MSLVPTSHSEPAPQTQRQKNRNPPRVAQLQRPGHQSLSAKVANT